MEPKKRTFGQRLGYVLFAGDGKDTSLLDRLVFQALGAEDFHVARMDDPGEKKLIEMVVGLSRDMGLAYPPPLLIYPGNRLSAASLVSGKIVISSGLLEALTPDQTKAVIGHELAHQRHRLRDWAMRLGIYAGAAGAITGLARLHNGPSAVKQPLIKNRVLRWFTNASGKVSPAMIAEDVGVVVSAKLLNKAYQRSLEYTYDAESAEFTGQPQAMAGALEVLQQRGQPSQRSFEPSWRERVGNGLHHLLRNHPPLDKRIARLKEIEARQEQIQSSGEMTR